MEVNMSTDYYILKILASLMEDTVYKQVYAQEVHMLFEMLKTTQENKLTDTLNIPNL